MGLVPTPAALSPLASTCFSSLGLRQKGKATRMLRKGPSLRGWTPVSDWKLGTGDQCTCLGTLHLENGPAFPIPLCHGPHGKDPSLSPRP